MCAHACELEEAGAEHVHVGLQHIRVVNEQMRCFFTTTDGVEARRDHVLRLAALNEVVLYTERCTARAISWAGQWAFAPDPDHSPQQHCTSPGASLLSASSVCSRSGSMCHNLSHERAT
eukprot:scaffold148651_cov31-Tisochrysis_lutea.AAC.4